MNNLSLESLFGDADLAIDCPTCQQNFTFKFSQALTDGSVVQCTHCGESITLKHDETAQKTIDDSSKALNDFNKSMKDLERTFKKLGK